MEWISTSLCKSNFRRACFATLCFSASALAIPLHITSKSDLDFGVAIQGDGAKTVIANSIETADNASFLVTGDSGKYFSIILPDAVELRGSHGGQVRIRDFTSHPRGAATLDRFGRSFIYIGATRDSISYSAVATQYSGRFQITVSY